ncbi:MAG TPA: polysaccharide deacetylase family protein [Candidatus Krumholzibacteria bacterium]|nr:polysaccharide deacetylase family protein [Candidatus Krumholzibacteria bacterium]
MSRFPVLMYHRVRSSRTPVADPAERPWAVSLEAFEWQLDRLKAAGKIAVTMAQAHAALGTGSGVPPEWVVLTFDDGNQSDHTHALPLLTARGFRATFFVCGCRVGEAGGLEPEMIREMHAAGMQVGSHAMTHRFLTTLSARDEEDELARSKDLLQGIVDTPVDHFAPPGGRWSKRTAQALRRLGYRAVSTSAFGYNDAREAKFAYRRIPVVDATTRARFDDILAGERWKLAAGYLRAGSLGLARRAMGEATYARLRGYQDR